MHKNVEVPWLLQFVTSTILAPWSTRALENKMNEAWTTEKANFGSCSLRCGVSSSQRGDHGCCGPCRLVWFERRKVHWSLARTVQFIVASFLFSQTAGDIHTHMPCHTHVKKLPASLSYLYSHRWYSVLLQIYSSTSNLYPKMAPKSNELSRRQWLNQHRQSVIQLDPIQALKLRTMANLLRSNLDQQSKLNEHN